MTMRTYETFGMLSLASAIHCIKVNNESVGDTVRAKYASCVKVHTCNYSHVAIVSFITNPLIGVFYYSKINYNDIAYSNATSKP